MPKRRRADLKADVRAVKESLRGLPEEFLLATLAAIVVGVTGSRQESLRRVAAMRKAAGLEGTA